MAGKDFLTLADFASEEVKGLVEKAYSFKQGETPRVLEGKVFALVFEKPSLRTRVSFEVGIRQMGGSCIYLSQQDIGLGVREPVADVARVLDRLVDGIIARVFSHRSLELLAENSSIPIVNALSDLGHPGQAIGDMLTVYEHKGKLDGLGMAFVGDGNNIAGSLALACGSLGMDFTIASPRDYQIPSLVWDEAKRRAVENESAINWVETPEEAVAGVDVVYTDVWISMGDEGEASERREIFSRYQISEDLVKDAKPDFIFMHDMPAHRGEEITEGMLDHPNSVVFDQAENRLHAQKAILAKLFEG